METEEKKAPVDHEIGIFKMNRIIGHDYKMQQILSLLESVANTGSTILLSGESGTGKTLLARMIHHQSSRSHKPLVEVNCGALPETLLESELFGHEKGAFTGAVREKKGKFEYADGGTIFLDDISTASASFQVKLLRVLQDKKIERIGGLESISVDVRVILASNVDLKRAVEEGTFREDLYYRINVVNVEIPPLRDRVGDIALLAQDFLRKHSEKNSRKAQRFHPNALKALVAYDWPGNVRELENVVERIALLCRKKVVAHSELPEKVRDSQKSNGKANILPLKKALEKPERKIIIDALEACGFNRQETARALKINRTTLYNKMKRLGLLNEKGHSGKTSAGAGTHRLQS